MRFYGSRSSALPPPQGRGPRPRAQRKLAPPLARIVASSFRNRSTLSPHLPACQRIFRDFVSALRRPPIGRRLRALLPAAADGERQRNAASEPADAAHVRERSRISVSRDLASAQKRCTQHLQEPRQQARDTRCARCLPPRLLQAVLAHSSIHAMHSAVSELHGCECCLQHASCFCV